ncbi:hypothetical protein AcV5_002539 [Taiwanofungus camphoratus]|nr:hypothetical protein AcV5_002539 [Antrodia cinnamomea]
MQPFMRIRQYFISSSPLWDAQRVSLTVASTFLAGLCAGDRVQMAPRGSSMNARRRRMRAAWLVFFGCRAPREDCLYADSDLKAWAELGIVDVRPAFSRSPEDSFGCKYVHEWAPCLPLAAAHSTSIGRTPQVRSSVPAAPAKWCRRSEKYS